MHLATKIAYNTIVQITSKILATILGIAAIAFITRYLGQTGFGEYTTAMTFLSFFAIVADLGLTLVTVQVISRANIDENKALGNLFGLRLVSALFFIGLAPLAVIFFPYSGAVKSAVFAGAASFVFIALNQVLVGLFQKKLRMDKVSIAEVANRIILLALVITVIHYDLGLQGIMYSTVMASFIGFILHYLFSRSFARIVPRFDMDFWQDIVKRSWPLAITIVLNLIYLKTDTLFLSLLKRQSDIGIIGEVGLYGAAYKVIDVLITLPFMFSGLILPLLTRAWTDGRKEDFNRILQRSFDVMAVIALPLMVGAQFISKELMVLIAGNEFSASGPILRVLVLAAGAIFLGNVFAHAVIALDKQKKIIGAYAFTALTAVAAYLLFIPRFSYFGAAWTTLYTEAFIALASLWLVLKYSDFRPSFNTFGKAVMATAGMALLLYILRLRDINNAYALFASAAACYFVLIYLFGAIRKQDLDYIMNKKN